MNANVVCCLGAVALEEESLPTRSSLLSRLRNLDDEASWRTFFDAYWRLLYNVARKSGLAQAEAQDVVQETVIAVARRMPAFHYDPRKGSFKNWLLLITRRRIQDHFRRLYRALPAAQASPGEWAGLAERMPAPGLAPDAQIEQAWEEEWRQNLLERALERVRHRANPKHYQAFDYCLRQGLPALEVGRMLGMTAAQVYLAKHRVGLMLKRAAAEVETEVCGRRAPL